MDFNIKRTCLKGYSKSEDAFPERRKKEKTLTLNQAHNHSRVES